MPVFHIEHVMQNVKLSSKYHPTHVYIRKKIPEQQEVFSVNILLVCEYSLL